MIGIENVNEFYTNHYLAAILGGDIKPQLEEWRALAKASDKSTPWQRLSQLQQDYFRHHERMGRLRPAKERVRAHYEINAKLLDALGHELKPSSQHASLGPLPLLAAYQRGNGEPFLWILPAAGAHGEEADVLARKLVPEQHQVLPEVPVDLDAEKLHEATVEEVVTDAFSLEEPPRFVLIVGDEEWVLNSIPRF